MGESATLTIFLKLQSELDVAESNGAPVADIGERMDRLWLELTFDERLIADRAFFTTRIL